jgi:glycosyltransferase involved in cell wall biosynthesis/GT2 family glycosyltransferase
VATPPDPTISTAKRPRVLFVSHETTLTGAPIQLLHLVRWLKRNGWELTVAAPEPGPISDLLVADGVEIVIHPGLLEEPGHEKLRELSAQFDVIVANTIVSWSAVRAAHLEGKPVIWYLHETLVAVRLIRQIPELEPTLELANLLVTPTRQTARIFQGITNTPIEVVPYGIPPAATVRGNNGDRCFTFVTAASVEPRKGQDILVEAIKALPEKIRDAATFKIVGRHLERPFFEEVKASAAGLTGVEFTGERTHSDSLELLAASDSLICSSRDETMPITILEAMSLGKVVISANVGGIAEWVKDGMNGLLVESENPEALSRAITRCMTDAPLVAQLRAGARRTFERHFTLERFAANFGRLLMNAAPRPRVRDWNIAAAYDKWITRFDGVDRGGIARAVRQMRTQPLISVLLPVYNPGLRVLDAALESIKKQIYDRWELCIADDASTDPEVRPFLERKAREDGRIKVTFRERNGHISACTNSALGLASGQWCALLDQDDAFSEKALAYVALEVERHPDAGVIYSDEDKIDEAGARSNPFFKPDWNPELFLGQNYINHLGVYRTELLRSIGGFREGFEGSQDYDLALRCVERLQPSQVRHIPRILYHWRAVAGSLAAVPDAKPYAKEAARRAIADHLQRRGIAGRVEPCPENVESHRVVYEIPAPAPLVSIVIPMRDRVGLLKQCLTSIRERTDYPSIEFVIVDNGSVETATLKFLRTLGEQSNTRVVRDDGAFNFSRLINRGAAAGKGDALAFLNNDVEANEPGWLREMVSHVMRPGVGAVGARLWYPDGTLQHGGVILGLGGVAGHAFPRIPRGHAGYFNRAWLQQNCSAVTAACMLVRREVFEKSGGFDEENLGISFNDVDFCLRLRAAGFQNVFTPSASLIHHESASRGHQFARDEQTQFVREATYMQRKWGAGLLFDPYYNPNLSLNLPGFELAAPPRLVQFSTGGKTSFAVAQREASTICSR